MEPDKKKLKINLVQVIPRPLLARSEEEKAFFEWKADVELGRHELEFLAFKQKPAIDSLNDFFEVDFLETAKFVSHYPVRNQKYFEEMNRTGFYVCDIERHKEDMENFQMYDPKIGIRVVSNLIRTKLFVPIVHFHRFYMDNRKDKCEFCENRIISVKLPDIDE